MVENRIKMNELGDSYVSIYRKNGSLNGKKGRKSDKNGRV